MKLDINLKNRLLVTLIQENEIPYINKCQHIIPRYVADPLVQMFNHLSNSLH